MKSNLIKTSILATSLSVLCATNSFAETPLMPEVSKRYIKLVLGVGEHEPGYVDAYYGPEELAAEAKNNKQTVEQLKAEAHTLLAAVKEHAAEAKTDASAQRFLFLEKQLIAIEARLRMLSGEKFSFDEETQLLFDATAPSVTTEELERKYKELDGLLEGEGSLQERMLAFKASYMIPKDKLKAVFDAAISECRTQTIKYMDLPANESFTKEFVTDKPWSGYNWYQGNANSLIQVNTDLPSPIDAAVNLGCHEGYPGHHVFNARLEEKLAVENGWIEFSVYPLYSPQSFLAEGTASYARHMAFPGNTQTEFEENILYPLAGMDPTTAQKYADVQEALGGLRYARIEGARRYIDGKITRDEAIKWNERYGLVSKERAAQMVDFVDTYGGYVINYTLGSDLTKAYVDRHGGTDHKARWKVYTRLLSEPFTASMMND
ncbi:MAG: hypothetical protein AB3N28_15500 [Kordiimonas sp.]